MIDCLFSWLLQAILSLSKKDLMERVGRLENSRSLFIMDCFRTMDGEYNVTVEVNVAIWARAHEGTTAVTCKRGELIYNRLINN